MRKIVLKILGALMILYILMCGLLFRLQEKLLFFPEKLDKDYEFKFDQEFEEIKFESFDRKQLHGLFFKSDSSFGLIYYLHGNTGSLRSWGEVAKTYTDLNYDVFMLDYRGFGKSEGKISNQMQFYQDIQFGYNEMIKRYNENKIIILGYSIGTGPATKIASMNKPGLLILQAPYYSLIDMMKHTYPLLPTFILKYKFETNKYIKDCSMPIVIFHGNTDEVIYYNSSIKLEKLLKNGDKLITLNGQGHNGLTYNRNYLIEIEKLLLINRSPNFN